MFDQLEGADHGLGSKEETELLAELERNKPEEIRRQRGQERIAIKAPVVVQPGNTSDLQKFKVQGTTGDVSEQGCRVLLPMPMGVGDIYRMTFGGELSGLPLAFARCIRCRMVREDAYEVGCTFFVSLGLSGVLEKLNADGGAAGDQ